MTGSMSDEVQRAIEVVAAFALANYATEIADWEDFPEVGEHDWERVVEEMRRLAPFPERGSFERAYKILEERVTDE